MLPVSWLANLESSKETMLSLSHTVASTLSIRTSRNSCRLTHSMGESSTSSRHGTRGEALMSALRQIPAREMDFLLSLAERN